MARQNFQEASRLILSEIEGALAKVQEEQAGALMEAMLEASAVFVTGEGRSGLVASCFAMRLMQLGLSAHVVGETVTPALKKGDLLVAVSGTGESEITCTRAELATKHGADLAAVTGSAGSSLASAANLTVVIPAATGAAEGAASGQYGGSQFEQAALVALDAIALGLQKRLGQSAKQMQARHATVE
ncbi:MAG: SIS domain-containing protein [Armatimonadota bacterium]|nr:MAG: SIS domain-containing protein [Armatimonadota bacterium]